MCIARAAVMAWLCLSEPRQFLNWQLALAEHNLKSSDNAIIKNMQTSRQKLQELLQQLFRADNADLDFGIYRIINYRRDQIQNFIDEKLPAIVNDALDANSEAESAHEELDDLANRVKEAFGDDVLDADGELIDETIRTRPLVNQYLEAKERLGVPQSRDQRADAIFNHLYTFFSRYYEDGDFIPRRRYSQTERYAIPYNGEEVYLHWANRDQYYVKSGEHFSAYRFKSQGITVTFDVRNVDIEKDNVQGPKRFFIPLPAETIYLPETAEICLPLEYRSLTDEEKARYGRQKQQDKINEIAETQILEHVSSNYGYRSYAALERRIDQITALKKHLDIYTRINTADFFIHKDLNQFLNRELDVYIKNEVIPLSNFILTNENLRWLETAEAVYDIASEIIGFLSRIEEFQKRLWLKKKFVLSTDYCITLDRVPEEFYPEITQNTAQREEWKHLFAIHEIDGDLVGSAYGEPLSVAFLKENPNLVLDTRHFDADFTDRLLAHFDNIDDKTDGLLIHGENFQALNLLEEKYRESIKTIYIDPPYNTKGTDFLFKDQYKHASWLSLMTDRISLSRGILLPDGVAFISIDDNEQHHLRMLMDDVFGERNFVTNIIWQKKFSPQNDAKYFSDNHDFVICYAKDKVMWRPVLFERTEEHNKRYTNPDNDPRGPWSSSGLDVKTYEEEYDYPITTPSGRVVNPPKNRCWRCNKERFDKLVNDNRIWFGKDKKNVPRVKRFLSEVKQGITPLTVWLHKEVGHTQGATQGLNDMGLAFSNPKPHSLIRRILQISTDPDSIILDYFAGSGTAAHATINLNRQDGGSRKYILVEMGEYFDTVLKPRVMKAVYAEKWKDAKPVSRESRLSHIIKCQRIESYEDALNNIQFTERENSLFEENLFNYLLGGETRESRTFLNVTELQNPFSYQLKIVDGLQTQTQPVDLPETFNYLLGISVQTRQCLYDDDRRYLIYRGTVGQKNIVIIWRETKDWKEEDWERDYRFIEENELTEGASEVYVNTSSIIPKAKPIDPLFKKLMFSQ